MNRVYKVIWSKAKHCYVVTSEIARSVTKSASSARSAGRKGAAVLAMAALLFTAGGVLGEAANVTEIAVSDTGNVITATKDDKSTDIITINNVDNAKEADYAKEATKAYSDGDGLVIKNTYAKVDTDGKVAKAVVADSAEQATKDGDGNVISTTYAKVDTDGKIAKAVAADSAEQATNDGDGNEISSTYVKNDDANLDTDGNYVKTDKKVGENLSALDTQVKANADAVAAEENARKAADKDNLKVDGNGVISKVTGDDGTTSSPVNKLVLNVDGNNPITMDDNGIKVGKNSTTMDKNGFYAGSDYNYGTAKAALDATEGKIRGADGNFKVNADGKVTAKGGVDTDGGEIRTLNGNINAGSGDISGKDITGSGTVRGRVVTDGTASMVGGALIGVTTITATGDISTGGKVKGTSVSDGTAILSGGSLTDAVNITASGTITGHDVVVNDKLTTKNLEVTDGFKTDHIILGSETNNYTDIYKGNVTSEVFATDGGVKYTAESIFNKDGSSITASADVGEHADSTGKSIVGAKEISQYLGDAALPDDSKKNVTRSMVRNGDTFSMEDKAVDKTVDGKNKYSTVRQNAEERKVTVTDGTKTLTVTENLTNGIVSETKGDDGTVTLTQGMDGTYKVETSGNQTNTVGGALTETVTGNVTEDYKANLSTKVGGNQAIEVTGNQENTVGGTLTETVTGNVTEDYKANLSTKVGGNQAIEVTGNQENTVGGTLTETVTGDVTEDYKANLDTNVTGDSSLKAENINNKATKALTNDANTITNKAHESVTTQIGNGTTVKSVMDVNGIANTASTGTITNYAVTITNTGVASVTNTVGGNEILVETNQVKSAFGKNIYTTWDADGITNITGNNTVISDNDGTTFANEDAKTPFEEGGKTGTRVNTKITGNKVETGKVLTDFAEVANNLDVGGNLNVEGNIETHDAVLSADSRQVVTGRQLYQTNERVDRLDNRIKKVGANAAALAALRPGDFNPDDKFSIAAGFGSYRNANAAALGLFYRPNENVLLSLGTSFGDGENMVNAGVSVKFGRGKSMAERRKEMAEEVSSMRDEMRSQDERIAELEEMLKKQSELIEKLSKES